MTETKVTNGIVYIRDDNGPRYISTVTDKILKELELLREIERLAHELNLLLKHRVINSDMFAHMLNELTKKSKEYRKWMRDQEEHD